MAQTSSPKRRQHSGRVTVGPCEVLGDDRYCEPLNRVWMLDSAGNSLRAFGSCTCGRRFKIGRRETQAADLEAWRDFLNSQPCVGVEDFAQVVREMWPRDQCSRFARDGIVPVGTRVLHESTRFISAVTDLQAADFEERLLQSMASAQGIGLAANQVGAPIRMLAHNLGKVAPQVLINPLVVDSSGRWAYEEGCLSLHVPNTRAMVTRPKRITVVAGLPRAEVVIIEADELLGRVLQHELDHLEGIEYVQRLVGHDRQRAYDAMVAAGVDIGWLPLCPY